jgi:putative copper resistance protein D
VPFGARILTVLAAVPFHAFLGVAIMSTSRPLAPTIYPSLDDQHSAGGLLWVSGELMSLVLASIVVHAWINADRRAAVRADARES